MFAFIFFSCDVLVVGGGIAGLQCIDTLTRECESIALPDRRLKIVQLEGQSRIGGRIESVKVTRDGEKEPITVEKGAAFIHSVSGWGHAERQNGSWYSMIYSSFVVLFVDSSLNSV